MSAEPQLDPMSIDRLVHEPARMAILSVLDGVADADFVFLQRVLGVTKGNLSAHLSMFNRDRMVYGRGFMSVGANEGREYVVHIGQALPVGDGDLLRGTEDRLSLLLWRQWR